MLIVNFKKCQVHRDLSGEAAQLMEEYSNIQLSIDTDWMHTYIPECWSAFVPLKMEYYKGNRQIVSN